MAQGKEHVPDEVSRGQVEALSSFGMAQEKIASFIGINDKSLRKHYTEELENAATRKHLQVGKFLFDAASGEALQHGANYGDCLRASIFFAKTQMRWAESKQIDMTSSDGSMTPSIVERVIVNNKEEL